MDDKGSSQAQSSLDRLMMAMRRSSAAGVLHSQAVAKKVGINSTDMECLDLILTGGPATAGEIGRRTGLTSGAVTGLIDRLERQGFVERASDPADRRKVVVRVREENIGPLAAHFAPMEAQFRALLHNYNDEQLAFFAAFAEQCADVITARVAALNRKD